jgi:inorganic pyrophosphatase
VPCTDPTWNQLNVLEDLPKQLRDEIAHFFSIYKDLEQKTVKVKGWFSREEALKEIDASRARFEEYGYEGEDGHGGLSNPSGVEGHAHGDGATR